MAELNRRLQLLLSEEQWEFYRKVATERGLPVSELIRRAMETVYRPATDVRALQALAKIRATDYRDGKAGSPS